MMTLRNNKSEGEMTNCNDKVEEEELRPMVEDANNNAVKVDILKSKSNLFELVKDCFIPSIIVYI